MATTRLTRTPSSAGNRKKFNFSFWIKGNDFVSDYIMFSASGSSESAIVFDSSSRLEYYEYNGSSKTTQITTNRVFRDCSAWYHINISIDTTQSTASNRVKFYVNGVQETSLANSTYGAEDFDSLLNNTTAQYIGGTASGGQFDGSMSHIHFNDGYVYPASTFGSTDSTTGEWEINTSPSMTMGTNGFTILKDGNIITDQSSNSNDWSLAAGTLTKTEDCPDNVFACINGIAQGTYNLTLTNGNNTVYCTDDAWRSAFSTFALSSGKYYFEVKRVGSSANMSVGIVDQSQLTGTVGTDKLQTQTRGYAYLASGQKGNSGSETSWGNAYAQNDIVGCAVDFDNGKIYFSKNGAWENSGDPTSGSTGTGSMYDLASGYDYLIGTSLYSTSAGASFNFGNGFYGTTAVTTNSGNGYAGAEGKSIFSYQPPTNYSALNTRGLNE